MPKIERKFTVVNRLGTWEDQSPDEVLHRVMQGTAGDTVQVLPQGEERTFDVFYGGMNNHRREGEQPRGWSQHRQVKALSHLEAVMTAALSSQHTSSCRYLVVGDEFSTTSTNFTDKVARVFRIDECGEDVDPHIVVDICDTHGEYTITEVEA